MKSIGYAESKMKGRTKDLTIGIIDLTQHKEGWKKNALKLWSTIAVRVGHQLSFPPFSHSLTRTQGLKLSDSWRYDCHATFGICRPL